MYKTPRKIQNQKEDRNTYSSNVYVFYDWGEWLFGILIGMKINKILSELITYR